MTTPKRTMRTMSGLIAACLLLLLVQNACAQEIPTQFRSDIERLLKMTGAEALGLQMGAAVSNQMVDSLLKQEPDVPPKAVEAVKDEIRLVFAEEMPKLMMEIVPIYARHFTHEEIKGLIAFYSTPLGKKSIAAMPAVMQECMQAGQAWGERISPVLAPRLESRLKQEGYGDK
ncbi:DUF2059 domain-containing protein [Geotalea sp. SG265]|uniref:DUF2059 domain-containing protein n=1 Tax=Geotalea sp. SG265 TaxID=2922867 RepID=UPI001FAEB6E5|nr:DUF2059 domain-containing protein [Geotalea sp. SG265]